MTVENINVIGGEITNNNAINVIGDANTNATFDDVAIDDSSGSAINVGTYSTYNGSTASPEAVSAFAPTALNNSDAFIGTYVDGSDTVDGFVYSGGVYTMLADPSLGTDFISVAISDFDVVVGNYTGNDSNTHAFVYDAGAIRRSRRSRSTPPRPSLQASTIPAMLSDIMSTAPARMVSSTRPTKATRSSPWMFRS